MKLGIALFLAFTPILMYFNAQERRTHLEIMKSLEVERLKYEALLKE
jgi:hypothetical protein